jgi:hypothetical protein
MWMVHTAVLGNTSSSACSHAMSVGDTVAIRRPVRMLATSNATNVQCNTTVPKSVFGLARRPMSPPRDQSGRSTGQAKWRR